MFFSILSFQVHEQSEKTNCYISQTYNFQPYTAKVGESRVLEFLLLARNSHNAAYREFQKRSNAVKELKVEQFENPLDLNFIRE